MASTPLSEATVYGRSRAGEAPPPDRGCAYGGPSCLACTLPQCYEDLTTEEQRAFRQAWQALQNRNGGA